MDDFTKIKLINSLIDVVDRFYTLKDEREFEDSLRLKGFCEGLSYALIELDAIDSEEAKQIMAGLGKKRELSQISPTPTTPKEEIIEEKAPEPKEKEVEKEKDAINKLKKEVEELEIDESIIHPSFSSFQKEQKENLDLPTYLRKKKI